MRKEKEEKLVLKIVKKKGVDLPKKGTPDSAGFDLKADLVDGAVMICPHKAVQIGTGISMEIPKGYYGGIYARSGLGMNGLRPPMCVGIIDSDYRGEIMVPLHNDTNSPISVKDGDRIAQFILHKENEFEFEVVEGLSKSSRANGGFGSTGKR